MAHIYEIHNAQTGEVIRKEFTTNEIKIATQVAEAEAKKHADALAAKAVARAALLTKLGITEQEAQLLLGS